jgi:hypothetical protein
MVIPNGHQATKGYDGRDRATLLEMFFAWAVHPKIDLIKKKSWIIDSNGKMIEHCL